MQNRGFALGTKLKFSVGALTAVLALMAWTGLGSITRLNESLAHAVDQSARKRELAGTLESAASDMIAGQNGLVLFTYAKDSARASQSKRLFQEASVSFGVAAK